jgi:hypothetical protein
MRSVVVAIAFVAITLVAVTLVAVTLPASAQDGKKLPPGYVLFPNAQGQNVPIKEAKTYAECMHNGHSLGYSQGDTEYYCQQHYPH